MEDPLTKTQKDVWLEYVISKFHEKYKEALTCGALSEEDLRTASFLLPMCVLQITAKQFEPTSKRGQEMLENLEKFI